MNIAQLITRAKQAAKIQSNYALAKRLNISQTALSAYKLGHRHPEPYIAEKLATLAGMRPEAGIAICEKERARSKEEKDYWEMRICVKRPTESDRRAYRRYVKGRSRRPMRTGYPRASATAART